MGTRRTLTWLGVLGAIAAAAGAAWDRSSQHVAYGALRDCLALRGGLVTPVAGGLVGEGTARVQVGTDTALLAVARSQREARALAAGHLDVTRHGNVVVSAGSPGPWGSGGSLALAAVERCLGDGRGTPTTESLGWIYPAPTIAALQRSCRKVSASVAQCRCVLSGAQARLSPAGFALATQGASVEAERTLAGVLDGCRLVG